MLSNQWHWSITMMNEECLPRYGYHIWAINSTEVTTTSNTRPWHPPRPRLNLPTTTTTTSISKTYIFLFPHPPRLFHNTHKLWTFSIDHVHALEVLKKHFLYYDLREEEGEEGSLSHHLQLHSYFPTFLDYSVALISCGHVPLITFKHWKSTRSFCHRSIDQERQGCMTAVKGELGVTKHLYSEAVYSCFSTFSDYPTAVLTAHWNLPLIPFMH